MKLTLLWDTVDRVRHYGAAHLPSVGGISLVSLSSTIMEKQFLRNSLGDIQLLVKDALWWYSHLGIGTWIYQRKHLHSVDTLSRFEESVPASLEPFLGITAQSHATVQPCIRPCFILCD